MLDRSRAVTLLCRALGPGSLQWPAVNGDDGRLFYEAARSEGVHLLATHRLWERGLLQAPQLAPELRERLTTALHQQAALEEITRIELRRVLTALSASGVPGLVIKGAALAYTHYPDPALRPRVDTDVLVPAVSRSSAVAALERLDYAPLPLTSGELVTHQAAYGRNAANGTRHVIDLHWKVSDPRVFAHALSTEELLAASIAVPALGDSARAPSPAHSLAIACIHRVAHHGGRDRLIWLYDIHVVAQRLSDEQRDAFVALAAEKQLRAVCREGLWMAQRCFEGDGTRRLLAAMGAARDVREPSAVFAERPMRRLDVLRSDLGELRGWRDKVKLLREHLFPGAVFMRQKYAIGHPVLLPVFYAWRIIRGSVGWLRPSGRGDQNGE